jgi:hypothetical protein
MIHPECNDCSKGFVMTKVSERDEVRIINQPNGFIMRTLTLEVFEKLPCKRCEHLKTKDLK